MLPREIQGDEQANRIKGALLQGLGDNRFFPVGGKVGFPCHHLYKHRGISGTERQHAGSYFETNEQSERQRLVDS